MSNISLKLVSYMRKITIDLLLQAHLHQEKGTRVIYSKALHQDRVNCVHWLTDVRSGHASSSNCFLSGGVDKCLYLCKFIQDRTDDPEVCWFN